MLIHISDTDSTNSYLRRRVQSESMKHLTAVVADYQTAGRGQVGNTWESAPGENLLMSVYLRPENLDVHEQFYLSMAVALAVCDALKADIPQVSVKWPNDIYVGQKKLAGILIENTLRGASIYDTIVGLGLNVNQDVFVSNAPNPISIYHIVNSRRDVMSIAASIVEALSVRLESVAQRDWQRLTRDYMTRLFRCDGQMYAFADAGGRFEARIERVMPMGHLVLRDTEGCERTYAFKEVEYLLY